MAEISLEMLEKLQGQVDWPGLDALVKGLKDSGQSAIEFSEIINNIKPSGAFLETLGKINTQLEKSAALGLKLGSDMADSLLRATGAGDLASANMEVLGVKTALAFEPLIGVIPKSIDGLGQIGKAGVTAGAQIESSFTKLEPVFSKVFGKIPGGKQMLALKEQSTQGAAAAFSYQRSIVALSAAQGRLSNVVDESTGRFVDLNSSYDDMIGLTYKSAQATGQSVESMTGLATQLGTIPGAMSDPIELVGKSMNQLVAVSQLATGFMMDQSVVAKQLGDMYTNLGVSGEDAFLSLSNVYEQAGDSKLRFEAFNSTVMEIAESFKIMGDNTEAATNIVKSFDLAFTDSNISPAAMQSVISGLTAGVQQMSTATASFVSAQTGGPGGLAGGLQIEFLKQEGKADEIMVRTMEALQNQFGGDALTLKNVNEDASLASEFFKQRQFIQNFLGVGQEQANRALEAMQSGAVDMMANAVGREDGLIGQSTALDRATDRGAAEQLRTLDPMIGLQQDFELSRAVQNKQYATAQQALTQHMAATDHLSKIADGSDKYAAMYGDTPPAAYNEFKPENEIQDRIDDVKSLFGTLMDVSGATGEGGGGIGSFLNMLRGKKEKTDEAGILAEPVGARVGTTAGRPTLPGERGPVETAPAVFGANVVQPRAGGTEAGGVPDFESIPLQLTSEPVRVQVELGQPFNQTVEGIVDTHLQRQVARGG